MTDLEFSRKYDREHAERYLRKHRTGFARRLSNWRDMQIARTALLLADEPGLVLDLPCGAGRFWPLLAEKCGRQIIAADSSADMLTVALNAQPSDVIKRVRLLYTSAFSIDLPDNAVDCVFSMRLLHHIGDPANRLAVLKEFHRVSRDSVILSLWVDGNLKSWRRKRIESTRAERAYQNRFVVSAKAIEAEFSQAGFAIQQHLDHVPLLQMWRVYVLRKVHAAGPE